VAGADHPDVAPLVDAFPDQGVLVFGGLRGSSLHDLVVGRRFDMDAVLPVVARSLAAFHAIRAEAVGVGPRPSGPRPDEFAAMATRHFPDRTEAYHSALQRLERIPAQIGSPSGDGLVHGDLHDRNILVAGRWVGMFDVATVHAGHPAEDVGSLAAHLLLSTLQRGARVRTGRRVVRCLLKGYREAGGEMDSRHVSAAGARTLFRLSCLYLFRRRWQGLTPALLDESVRWSNWARGHVA
jgi:aminoglycoside phosphotransferase (APT) family kinase protein